MHNHKVPHIFHIISYENSLILNLGKYSRYRDREADLSPFCHACNEKFAKICL